MNIYINGQDIRRFALADVSDPASLRVVEDTKPEAFLAHLVSFLEERGKTILDVQKAYVVVGPGSATALRSSLSIANTLGFAAETPLISVEKDPSVSDEDTLAAIDESASPVEMLTPVYSHEARITTSNKDQLNRER